jgi:hypothetical protein
MSDNPDFVAGADNAGPLCLICALCGLCGGLGGFELLEGLHGISIFED